MAAAATATALLRFFLAELARSHTLSGAATGSTRFSPAAVPTLPTFAKSIHSFYRCRRKDVGVCAAAAFIDEIYVYLCSFCERTIGLLAAGANCPVPSGALSDGVPLLLEHDTRTTRVGFWNASRLQSSVSSRSEVLTSPCYNTDCFIIYHACSGRSGAILPAFYNCRGVYLV